MTPEQLRLIESELSRIGGTIAAAEVLSQQAAIQSSRAEILLQKAQRQIEDLYLSLETPPGPEEDT